jgi:hypothetical protein
VIKKKDSGDEHIFCTTLMEKTVGEIGILNSELFSDQNFLQCRYNGVSSLFGTKGGVGATLACG